uniref:Golgi integral membrane protein 4 n=1 Tax=Poecilia latipinna TaxID=48699 RepID=A0A3B3U8D1_9TELE
MGNGVCSRRQRRIFQCLLLVTVVCGMMYGGLMSYEMHKQLRRTEATALKYQQHQESLSAQLQVVYEHRSRLEKSLQKERLEHKKAKEDYLVYKLEAEQSLNKEKQDANSRLNSLQVQHQMLKNQHDELKRQYYELNEQHQAQGEDHGRLLDEHRDRYNKLQQAKEVEVSQLKEHVYNLREENKQLRKAHHEIHTQLQDAQHQNLKAVHDQLALTLEDHKSALAVAQAQVDEYKQLKETLNREPNRDNHAELHQGGQLQQQQQAPAQVYHLKSAYEQQQEQRRLETLRDNERRQIQMRQEALQAQREKVLKEREQRLKEEKEREEQQNREADRKEQLLREEHQRKRLEYENMNEDVPREEDRRTANEGGETRKGGVDGEVDPEDDPNNQGEDEFEEAEDEHPEEEPAAPGQHIDSHPGPGRPAMEEELVMAGNPDQQEDALDDQYQEEDEVTDSVLFVCACYVDQNDAKNQDGPRKKQNHQNGAHEEENYEEEEEEVEEDAAGQDKGTNRRAEM